MSNRYRLYREHKYLFAVFTELLQYLAIADFSEQTTIEKIRSDLQSLQALLAGHADYEENRIHVLLKDKNDRAVAHVEQDHQLHDQFFVEATQLVDNIDKESQEQQKFQLAYQLYQMVRKFFGEMLLHFDYEETQIMPSIQQYYDDQDIKAIEFETYQKMLPEHMIGMIQVVFPYLNKDDKQAFLNDMKQSQPEKFAAVENQIEEYL